MVFQLNLKYLHVKITKGAKITLLLPGALRSEKGPCLKMLEFRARRKKSDSIFVPRNWFWVGLQVVFKYAYAFTTHLQNGNTVLVRHEETYYFYSVKCNWSSQKRLLDHVNSFCFILLLAMFNDSFLFCINVTCYLYAKPSTNHVRKTVRV